MLCTIGTYLGQFFEETNDYFYTQSYRFSPKEYHKFVKPTGNYLTGYYSDVAPCNDTPGATPGFWVSTNLWQSTCQGAGIKRELTILELMGAACGRDQATFCESLTDQGGNKRKPEICGGTDPNFFSYNPSTVALGEIAGTVGEMTDEAKAIADQIVLEQRKRIFFIALLIVLIIIITRLIL